MMQTCRALLWIFRWPTPAIAGLLLFAPVSAQSVDFDSQVMPILTKAGCNAGSCHGAAAGRGGFHLSLSGSRPQDDFEEIAWALDGRRVHQRVPEQSLLLLKPTEQVSHEGGTRLDIDGRDLQTLQRWIQEGAIRTPGRTLLDFRFGMPRHSASVHQVGQTLTLTAVARFSDDADQDVLPWTVIKPDDPSATEIGDDGSLRILRPGRHVIIARYLDRVVPLEILATESATPTASLEAAAPATIDGFIDQRLQQLGLTAANETTDAEFQRRLTLDLTGRLPQLADVQSFASDDDATKRERLIKQLLQSDAIDHFWTFLLAQQFRANQLKQNNSAAQAYYDWLAECVSNDVGLDVMVQQLILAEGAIDQHGPASFYAVVGDARAQAEFFSRAFLGVRLECANCHDHPLDMWTQDDYHGLAAIFAPIKRGSEIQFTKFGEVIHPATGDPAIPRIPSTETLSQGDDHRPQLAAWLTSPANPYFAKAAVNRIWKHLMGRGLVDPVDDLRVTNPATHPELLDWLAQQLVADGYQLRPTIQRICESRVYQRSSRGREQLVNDVFYSRAAVKPLTAAVLLDAIADVTGVPTVLNQSPSRAVSLAGLTANSESLQTLGRCDGDSCESPSTGDGLPVKLHLLTGDTLNARLANPDGRLLKHIAAGKSSKEIVHEFYLRAVCRQPTATEREFWEEQFQSVTDRTQFAELAQDFLWSVLNSNEFRTNP